MPWCAGRASGTMPSNHPTPRLPRSVATWSRWLATGAATAAAPGGPRASQGWICRRAATLFTCRR
eukprot:939903-Alexandrium_andersonii.AAC.1